MTSSSRSPITVRLGTTDDDPAIAQLIATGAPGNPKADLDVLRWQYRTEEFGPTVTVVAEADGQVVGHYSAITVPFSLDRREIRAVRGVDIVTAPAHRGRGVFAQVTTSLVDQLGAARVDVVISNPNDSSQPVLARRGWHHVGDPLLYVLPVDGAALADRAPVPFPKALGRAAGRTFHLARRARTAVGPRVHPGPVEVDTIERSGNLPDGLDELIASTAAATGIARSARWLQWRYLDHPRHPYRLTVAAHGGQMTGLAVTSIRDDADGRFVQLLELSSIDVPSGRALVDAAIDQAKAEGAAAVVGAALEGSAHQVALRSGGLWPVPRRLQPRPIHLLVADLTDSLPDVSGRQWNFSLGDQDHL